MAYAYEVDVATPDYCYRAIVKGTRSETREGALDGLTTYCNALAASGQNKAGMRIYRNARCISVD